MAASTPDQPADIRKFRHPGGGRGGRAASKGRQVEPGALAAVRDTLGEAPRDRDLLIEHLHLLQDRFGCLSLDHLAALAHDMRLAQAEVYETASFYAHFDIVADAAQAPAQTVRVCDGVVCAMSGAEALIASLQRGLDPGVRVMRAPCMGGCDRAPAAAVGHNQIPRASLDSVAAAVASGDVRAAIPDYRGLAAYRADGGYALLGACRAGRRTVESVIAALEDSGLRGLGGAGFPAARKWRLVRDNPAPRYLAINADEGEPGTFKDRFFLETDPHRVLEGALVAAWAVEAAAVYLYLRDEYPAARAILTAEIAALEAANLAAPGLIRLRRGAGAYICGEESAMLESIEGKRGLPRHKPPFPAEIGLFGRPTLIHNVETLAWIRDIMDQGPAWFAGQGRAGGKGLRAYSVSGRVRRPGVKIAPAGISPRALIDEFCGGMAEGHALAAFLPGGASGGILPASLAEVPLDFGQLEKHGGLVGSAALVVLSEADDVAAIALNLMRFFEDESCGQCTPCRAGCEKAVKLMERPGWDGPLLRALARAMADASICGLGQAAPNGLLSVLDHFPEKVPGGGAI